MTDVNKRLVEAIEKVSAEWARQKSLFNDLSKDGWMDLAIAELRLTLATAEAQPQPQQRQQQGAAVAWKVTPRYEDADGYFDFTDDEKAASNLQERGWKIRPLIYADSVPPAQEVRDEALQMKTLEPEFATVLDQVVSDSMQPTPPAQAVPEDWLEAVKEFVERCENGEVRSKHTYAKFKALLAAAPKPDATQAVVVPDEEAILKAAESSGLWEIRQGVGCAFGGINDLVRFVEALAAAPKEQKHDRREQDI